MRQIASSSAGVEPRAGRIVRIADQDGLRASPSRARTATSRSGTPAPVPLVGDERPGSHGRAEPRDRPRDLHVVRHHHHDVVARLDEVHRRDAVGFGAAVGDLDVIRRRARIHRRDRAPQLQASRSSADSRAPATAAPRAHRRRRRAPRPGADARRFPTGSRRPGSPRSTAAAPSRTVRALGGVSGPDSFVVSVPRTLSCSRSRHGSLRYPVFDGNQGVAT